MSRPLPRLFLIRHGETEWSLNGHSADAILEGTDIPLTPRGESQIKEKAQILVGDGKPIDPKNLCTVFVSPRQRAHATFHLLFSHIETPSHVISEDLREWDYGDYEGLLSKEITEKRGKPWNIWVEGCPGGESAEDMKSRVDVVISRVREHHRLFFEEGIGARDVVIVAHGHFNRVMIARWLNCELPFGTKLNVEPGGVSVLSYNHNTLVEPALNALNLHADLR
ncbi:phosphoglycerate mutase-like protein [Flagelloscypha sp. PMI_526]|nr:phosphoglycerate mutase-like protein [Flagelloscypha sp. PMI_526]